MTRGPSQATALVELARESYRLARATTGEPFAVATDGPNIARMLRGGQHSLRSELAARYADLRNAAPSASALADAVLTLEGLAMREPEETLHLRVARDGSNLWLDLGDEVGRAVLIKPGSWQILDGTPMVFRRTKLTACLPEPKHGGDLAKLRGLLNVTDESWPLLLAFLVHALIADEPHAVLLLTGEQGSAKSTAERLLATLVDPSGAPLRSTPKDLDDWSVAAAGSWLVPLDNVSHVSDWLSDAICRASTGDGLVKRRLYSDDDLAVLSYRRVVMLSSIDAGSLRGDLADRLLLVELDRIPPERRRRDAEVLCAFGAVHAEVLGGLLDILASVLSADVHLDRYPRMADFATRVAAMDQVLGTTALDTYLGQAGHLAQEVVEGDPVALAVQRFIMERGHWEGPGTELLNLLVEPLKGTRGGWPDGWPKTTHHFAGRLKRAAASLRALGVNLAFSRSKTARFIHLGRVEGTSASPASSASPRTQKGDAPGDADDAPGDADDAPGDADANTDDAGDADFILPLFSPDLDEVAGSLTDADYPADLAEAEP